MAKIRVLVVDDSATMRGLITAALNRDPGIEVVGAAGDPFEARGMIKALNPDVVTLDIEMPNMNGIEFLEKIMRLRPMPVVMVSTLTQAGAEMTLRALELGAIDCVAKPADALGTQDALAEIVAKVKIAARASVRTKADASPVLARKGGYMPSGDVVAIGSSTGGVEALLAILTMFPETCPPTVITQHMPATFTASFAARLDRASGAKVQEASDGALLEPGKIYVAPGGATHLEVVRSAGLRCRLVTGDPVSGHRPSVDVLFGSVAQAVGDKAVGVILTGMGRDGAQGLLTMRKAGAKTLGQDEQSCVVYGMPRSAFEIGAVEKQVSLSSMGQSILDLASARR
ncbi:MULTISPECIES: protein-glutamate methylesterase/protein-glutamine glutaminase [unclassified Caulobacter]|uniref:protein-glutamate methylesterase/protein-glutamine glutaminase n=1 Tax=unclassified Caulobacter TaxID=2648921 RepID=UPI000D361DA8|nr:MULTISPECIES: chemotaxis response regulator protein-glutamate methylesterase [unclassified Caulobacter]PTS88131.1 chemotaxis response regulator protein-glutamate methylesterase [Caulobacter sp. HMWF009]PTT06637.1 chemotaxis response regulator protein-glutamate methylesterase [Caulobacter sp. HMWF025]